MKRFFKAKYFFFFFTALCLGFWAAKYSVKHDPRKPASASLDFNAMIEESQKNTAELNAQFQRNAGIEKKVLNAGQLTDESKSIPVTPEQFAAHTSRDIFANTKVETSTVDEKAEMKRLSRELQEVEN